MKTKTIIASSAAVLLVAQPLLADVREGLVAYWPMNTASGDYPMVTPDVAGGNDLTGPVKPSSDIVSGGKFGNCAQFFGSTSDYLNFITAPGTDTGLPAANNGSWTWALWVKGPSGQANQTTYFTESSSINTSGNPRFSMEGNGADKTRYFLRDINNVVKSSYVGTKPTLDDTWHHVAYTYDADQGKFLVYVDGQPDYTNTFTYTRNLASWDQVGIGALVRNTVGVPFVGQIDDVAIWARVLSQGEIQEVLSNSIATPIPQFAPALTVQPRGATNLYVGDNYTMSAAAYGSRPMYYQWLKDGTNVPGANSLSLTLSSVTAADSGQYQFVVTNAIGAATSVVAQITVNTFGSPDLTNGLVAYWPLDTLSGVKTPDLVSAYDLTVNNMASSNVVPGKWGNALAFDAASSQYARRIHNPGDPLPAYPRTNFTVSAWVKAPWTAGSWFFTESSTLNNNPAFCLGQRNSYNDKLNTFVRIDSGTQVNDNRVSSTVVWDDNWHHVAWVQRAVGNGAKAELYIDGVRDSLGLTVAYPVSVNNTALGAFARATPGQFFTGLVDEVAIWERPLSPDEVALLAVSYITNPPSRLTPLVVNSFKSDFPAVVKGDSTLLRWDVPANATQVLIDPLGDVTANTSSGIGSTNVTITQATTFVLTVKRGLETARATNTIGVVDGVAANWSLLDNFDQYEPGLLAAGGWWVDFTGNSVGVVAPSNCNRLAKTLASSSGAYLKLKDLAVTTNQSRTLFFRMIPQGNPTTLRHIVGVTDKPANFYYQLESNVGPMLQTVVGDASQNPGDWVLAARNIPYSPLTFDTNVLQPGAVYCVWIDVTNVLNFDNYLDSADIFSIYIQKEGEPARTAVFTNFLSDRDLGLSDPLTGGYPTENLTRVYLAGNSATDSALFDDFYVSKSGYNSTIPRPYGYAGPQPSLQLQQVGGQWQVVFQGKLQEASSVNGTWSEVTGATSPYPLTTTGGQKFYRAVCY